MILEETKYLKYKKKAISEKINKIKKSSLKVNLICHFAPKAHQVFIPTIAEILILRLDYMESLEKQCDSKGLGPFPTWSKLGYLQETQGCLLVI